MSKEWIWTRLANAVGLDTDKASVVEITEAIEDRCGDPALLSSDWVRAVALGALAVAGLRFEVSTGLSSGPGYRRLHVTFKDNRGDGIAHALDRYSSRDFAVAAIATVIDRLRLKARDRHGYAGIDRATAPPIAKEFGPSAVERAPAFAKVCVQTDEDGDI